MRCHCSYLEILSKLLTGYGKCVMRCHLIESLRLQFYRYMSLFSQFYFKCIKSTRELHSTNLCDDCSIYITLSFSTTITTPFQYIIGQSETKFVSENGAWRET